MFEGLKFSTSLPNGVYYNREPQPLMNTLFVDLTENKIKTFAELHDKKLHILIYNMPYLLFPYIDDDIKNGSIFENCFIPSCAYNIICYDSIAEIKPNNPKKITKNEYVEIYYNLINEEIKRIYSKHDIVVLQYSGGIDSILLLSFIISLKLLQRTILVVCENWFSPPLSDVLRYSNEKRYFIDKLKLDFEGQYFDFIKLKFTDDDWVSLANNYTSFQIKSHSNFFVFEKFKQFGVIAGHYGDDILLHDDKWLEEIILESDDRYEAISKCKNLLQNKKFYLNYELHFDPEHKKLNPLTDYTFFLRNWDEMIKPVGTRNYYCPIGVDTRLCRSIDIKTVDMIDILDAKIPKTMIQKNVGHLLDNYIFHKSDNDGDRFHAKNILKTKFVDSIFHVPKKLNHNKKGLIRTLLADLHKEKNVKKFFEQSTINTKSVFSLHLLKTIYNIFENNNNGES